MCDCTGTCIPSLLATAGSLLRVRPAAVRCAAAEVNRGRLIGCNKPTFSVLAHRFGSP